MHLLPSYNPGLDPPFPTYFRNTLEQIQLAEELVFECFWFTEHHFVLYGGPVPNPAVMMSAAAARTSTIRLGSAISILPLHHPLQVAEDYAMVDVVSGGRLNFGMGIGNTPGDFEAYDVPRDEARDRFAEAVDVITAAWTNERFSHTGKFWQIEDVALYPKPVQQPHPPYWVAGSSPASLGAAGRRGWSIMTVSHPFPPDHVRPGVEAWHAGLLEGGHDPAVHHCKLHVRVWVDENGAKAKELAEAAIVRYDTNQRSSRAGRYSQAGAAPPEYNWDEMLAQGRNAYGNPDQVIQAIENARRHFDFDVFSATFAFGGMPHEDVKRSMRLFASEVMPAFRD